MTSHKRILVLPISAAIILALVVYKETRTYPERAVAPELAVTMQRAPLFEAYNTNNQLAKFERYIGRHRIIVVFYDGKMGADRDEALLQLNREYDSIKRSDTVVVGISTALPQQNRKAFGRLGKSIAKGTNQPVVNDDERQAQKSYEQLGRFPFPLLSDVDFSIHQLWGLFDEKNKTTSTGLFFVDRTGQVAWEQGHPKPLTDPNRLIQAIIDEEL